MTVTACGGNSGNSTSVQSLQPKNPLAGYKSAQYDGPENWLCRPDIGADSNACLGDFSKTVVHRDGSTALQAPRVDPDPGYDCFYVYPTVSEDATLNADLNPGAEVFTATVQAGAYSSGCRLFAPLYRQVTVSGLFGGATAANWQIAYDDVVDAFKAYAANNDGRPFLLIGHSQGTAMLMQLIRNVIEPEPWLTQRMVAAHLIGITVQVPANADVGGTFATTPPCTSARQAGCFISYTSHRHNIPPMAGAGLVDFGVNESDELHAVCTNPAALAGGAAEMDAIFPKSTIYPYNDADRNAAMPTPYFSVPGLIKGECIKTPTSHYLAITYLGDPNDQLVDDMGGDLAPGWGLHLIDIQLAQGNLLSLAEEQYQAWRATQ